MSVELTDAFYVRIEKDKKLQQAFQDWLAGEEEIFHLTRGTIAGGDNVLRYYTFAAKDRLKIKGFFIDYEMREGMKVYAG